MKQFFAKSSPKKNLEEHTNDVLAKYKEFKEKYPYALENEDWELLKLAIIYHDFGKMDVKFQNKIRQTIKVEPLLDKAKDEKEIPHNYLSPCYIDKKIMEDLGISRYTILVRSIFYHHDRVQPEDCDIRNYIKNRLHIRENIILNDEEIPLKKQTKYLNFIEFEPTHSLNYNQEEEKKIINKYLIIKGLLNRMDYAASGGLEYFEEDCMCADGKGLYEKVKHTFERTGRVERPMQINIQKQGDNNQIIVASTGAGKTEAALLWLGNQKGFYTLPLKVSINAIYKRIQDEIQYDKVGLLHSDAFAFYLDEESKKREMDEYIQAHKAYTGSKMLAKPLTVCTIDQLFKFVYLYNGGEVALSTLSYSKLIIDEIQMYSPDLVATIIVALKKITELGGKFLIITATFPPVLYQFFKEHKIDVQIPEKTYHGQVAKRHKISVINDFNIEEIIKYAKRQKVLIIVNTIKNAQVLYKMLKQKEPNAYIKLLHSQYIKKHRDIIEHEILQFAPNDKDRNSEPGIWISTQIVEASLDIDFDILYTEMCSIDSLLQRMGRVYRSREYLGLLPNVYIVDNKNHGDGMIIDKEIYDFSLNALKNFDGQLLEESDEKDDKQVLISKVYDPNENPNILKSNYYKIVEKKINDLLSFRMYSFKKSDAIKQFRNIHSVNIIPEPIYKMLKDKDRKIQEWEGKLQSKDTSKENKHLIKNEIEQYTMNLSLSENEYLRVEKMNTLTEIIYTGSQIYVAPGTYEYDKVRNSGLGYSYLKKPWWK